IVDDIKVEIIKTSHDSGESVGFIISDGTSSMVHITDTGYINNKYFNKLSNHNLYVFESNHDIEMLMTGEYPYYLKRRILGNKGHLSNDDAAFYLSELVGSKTKTIVLAHLSDDNNTYEKAISSVVNTLNSKHKKVNKIIVAKQKERTDFIKL
ncbi:MAG: MBL fold metallo-hydrolase, partial [Bacilli bacterium]